MAMSKKRLLIVAFSSILLISILAVAFMFFLPTTGSSPLKIELVPDKTSYLQGENVHFEVYVTNPNSKEIPHPADVITWQIVDFGPLTEHRTYPEEAAYPPSSRTKEGFFDWRQNFLNGTQVPPGNYTLTVSLRGATNYGSASCTVEIR